MKKIVALFTVLLFVGGLEVAAIGLPNNTFIQKKAENRIHFPKHSAGKLMEKGNDMIVTKAKSNDNRAKKSTLETPGDIQTYTVALATRFVNFVAAALLGMFSMSHSMADELHMVHGWFLTDFPPQC